MDDSPIALRRTIEATKEELSHDIDVLEAKGKELVDWRAHVDKRPLAMLGVAFVGGAIAAAIVSGGRSSRRGAGEQFAEFAPRRDRPRRDSSDTWSRLRSGIGAAAAGVAMEALSKAMPEVKKHLIDPLRTALRPEVPEKRWSGIERRFSGMDSSASQGNGHSG